MIRSSVWIVAALALFFFACNSVSSRKVSSLEVSKYQWERSSGIEVGYLSQAEAKTAKKTLELLLQSREAVQKALGLSDAPPAQVVFAGDRAEFDGLVRTYLGYSSHQSPSRESLVAVTGKGKMVFLFPTETKKKYQLLVHHETVHLFHAYLNPLSDDAPKYWIEGLPWVLSGQYLLEDSRKPILEALNKREIPRLRELATDDHLAYVWGWTIAKYILDSYPKEKVWLLLRTGTSDNFFMTLDETQSAFEQKWKEYLSHLKGQLS